MEYKLNKIDTDIRKKIEEERKVSKIHPGKSINVNKDLKEEVKNEADREEKDEKQKKKRFFIIDGIKYSKNEFRIDVEKDEKISIQNSIGGILDAKK